tara:strand:- start:2764 stop:3780 length:1017 start_codon:yes stop_codon:yes gene_type:complete
MKKINWGIIGLGKMANFHLKSFNKLENCELKGIASKNLINLQNFKKKLNIKDEFCFNNYEDLIKNSEINIIYIALPNSYHYEWINKCIDYNKNILVEKPITKNFFQLKSIKEKLSQKKSQILIYEGFMYKYHAQIKKVLEFVNNGEIGKVTKIISNFGVDLLTKKKFLFFNKKRKIDKEGRLFSKKLGGGCILDLGCYPVSFTTMLLEKLESGKLQDYKILNKKVEIGETGVDIDSKIEMKINEKIHVKLFSSFKRDIGSGTEIFGSEGSIEIPNTWFGSSNIILKKKKSENEIKFEKIDDPYFDQINEISNDLLSNSVGQSLDNMLLNMKILDQWLN